MIVYKPHMQIASYLENINEDLLEKPRGQRVFCMGNILYHVGFMFQRERAQLRRLHDVSKFINNVGVFAF